MSNLTPAFFTFQLRLLFVRFQVMYTKTFPLFGGVLFMTHPGWICHRREGWRPACSPSRQCVALLTLFSVRSVLRSRRRSLLPCLVALLLLIRLLPLKDIEWARKPPPSFAHPIALIMTSFSPFFSLPDCLVRRRFFYWHRLAGGVSFSALFFTSG